MGDIGMSGASSAKPKRTPAFNKWSKKFLAHLAQTSNVTASAAEADITTSVAYKAKRTNPEFNRDWRQALCDGYELLELELLDRLRTGQDKGADGKTPARLYDNAIAFRLLVAHRSEAVRQRAVRDNQDADAIFASIDTKLDRMRKAQLAAAGVNPDAHDPYDDEE